MVAAGPPGLRYATFPMLALSADIQYRTLICTDTDVIQNLTLNPGFNPLLVCQFRIISTNPSISISTLNRYIIAT